MNITGLFTSGARQFRDHPQLWLTIGVATAIVGSFVYVASSFSTIAKNAQDQLVNVRIGSLQDAFSPLASELWGKPDDLRGYMQQLQGLNPTIVHFDIVRPTTHSTTTPQWVIALSTDPSQQGQLVYREDLLLGLARTDPTHSYTAQASENGDRYFYTARAVLASDGTLRGVILTQQTLSQADQEIESNLRSATITLILILLFLLLLFFRHARIIDYTVLYQKLREVDTLKDDFIAMASHELRAPLTAIRGYAEMLSDGTLKGAEQLQAVQRIDLSAHELDMLVADMLDVSRIEQGRMKVDLQTIDTRDILAEVCDTWGLRAKEKGLTLERAIGANLTISADPDRFRQIAINLLSNAVKYTEKGTITVHSYVDGNRFVLRVSDTGIGMSENERQRLFAKFYRAAGSAVRAQQGTGLGLWITKQLVEYMGGQISVESIKGVGSHFIVTFPLARG